MHRIFEGRVLRMITVKLAIMVYGERDTVMSFIRCTVYIVNLLKTKQSALYQESARTAQ